MKCLKQWIWLLFGQNSGQYALLLRPLAALSIVFGWKKKFSRDQNLDKPDDIECKFLVEQHSIMPMIKVSFSEVERIAGL